MDAKMTLVGLFKKRWPLRVGGLAVFSGLQEAGAPVPEKKVALPSSLRALDFEPGESVDENVVALLTL